MRRTRTLLLAAVLGATAGACASHDRSAALAAFESGRYDDALRLYEAEIAEGGAEVTLDRNSAGVVSLVQGDLYGARFHFQEAFLEMEDLSASAGETAGAMVGPERSKTWKGDPFDRCMNAYYLGITSWLLGDVDNAAAAFKAGLLRDGDSAREGNARSDFGLLWFLMGWAQRDARHEDRGEQALAMARGLDPKNPWMVAQFDEEPNLLLVVELGMGPVRKAAGSHGSDLDFRSRYYPAAWADVEAGGKEVGRTYPVSDLLYQATTRGTKTLDSINKGKAVFKDAAAVAGVLVLKNSGSRGSNIAGGALLLASLLTPAEADTRSWDVLPGEVQVLLARLPPGTHELDVRVKDSSGRELRSVSPVITVTVDDRRLTFAWARAVPPPVQSAP